MWRANYACVVMGLVLRTEELPVRFPRPPTFWLNNILNALVALFTKQRNLVAASEAETLRALMPRSHTQESKEGCMQSWNVCGMVCMQSWNPGSKLIPPDRAIFRQHVITHDSISLSEYYVRSPILMWQLRLYYGSREVISFCRLVLQYRRMRCIRISICGLSGFGLIFGRMDVPLYLTIEGKCGNALGV